MSDCLSERQIFKSAALILESNSHAGISVKWHQTILERSKGLSSQSEEQILTVTLYSSHLFHQHSCYDNNSSSIPTLTIFEEHKHGSTT